MKLFNELKDVTVREEVVVEKSDLEKVLDIETEIINKYKIDKTNKDYSGEERRAFQAVCAETQERVADIKITPKLLQEYIEVRENTEKNVQAKIRGMYSAALLELAYTKNPDGNLYINGKGKTFNYLFYHANNIKKLTLTNMNGNFLLGYSSYKKGIVEHVTILNAEGDNILGNSGWEGNVQYITLINLRGGYTLHNAGSFRGNLQYVTLTNVEEFNTLGDAGMCDGKVKNILREKELNQKQKKSIAEIKKIVETMQDLSLEKQKTAHEKIAQLQKEIFAGKKE